VDLFPAENYDAGAGKGAVEPAARSPQPPIAAIIADDFKDKNVSIVVGYAAGGGADLWSRFLARHIGRYIPGEPNVIVRNMPGAGGFRAVNYVYNVGPKDGTMLILPTTSAITAPKMGIPNVRWDTFQFQWMGNLTRDVSGCVASGQPGIKSITYAKDKQIIFGADGQDDPASHQPRLLNKLLGYHTKIIAGYKGTGPAFMALEIGEIDARCSVWASQAAGTKKADFESGKLVPIMQTGSKKAPIFGDAPMIYDLARNEEDLKIMKFLFGPMEVSRPFALPPGVPAEVVAALRKAFWDAAKSDHLLEEAKRLKLVIDPMTGKETEALLRASLDVSDAVVRKAKTMITP
jgi:tripartite-type tricarboxylate transporter receptor subunit TctC